MNALSQQVSVSIVSHGHGDMVWALVERLEGLPSVAEVIVTLNIPEALPRSLPKKAVLIHNQRPLGFGANHNQAFSRASAPYYCVLNPDIRLTTDPFPNLLVTLNDPRVGVVGPRVINAQGEPEDSLRQFPTPLRILRRHALPAQWPAIWADGRLQHPDWIAGMFMLFKASDYRSVKGFDAAYFMYCEDADLCTRLWLSGRRVAADLSVTVVHDARRASRRSLRHLKWHLVSLIRYWLVYWRRLPRGGV